MTQPWIKEEGVSYLLAVDIDGTLVKHDGSLSPAVAQAARQVIEAGHHLVISTGRSTGATLPILQEIGLTQGHAVCANGAVTLSISPAHPGGYRVIDRVSFDPSQALTLLKDRFPQASIALETPDGTVYSTPGFEDWSFGVQSTKASAQELADMTQAVRLVLSSEKDTSADFRQAVKEVGLHGVNYAVGWSAWLDISAHGVTKASALEQLRRKLGVDPRHTISAGDGLNDLDMLAWAARGVAMGQALPEVKAKAREVTGSVDKDGLLAVFKSLI